jgi:hypothetical protein
MHRLLSSAASYEVFIFVMRICIFLEAIIIIINTSLSLSILKV